MQIMCQTGNSQTDGLTAVKREELWSWDKNMQTAAGMKEAEEIFETEKSSILKSGILIVMLLSVYNRFIIGLVKSERILGGVFP